MKSRSQIEEKYKWDLSFLCANDDEFEKSYAKSEKLMQKCGDFKGKLKDKKQLYDCLKFEEEFAKTFYPIAYYASHAKDVDLSSSRYSEKIERCDNLGTKYAVAMSYVEPEMAKFSDKYIDELLADPLFKDYDYSLRLLKRQKKHMLSDEASRIISGMNFLDFGESFSLFSDSGLKFKDAVDSRGKKHELTSQTASLLLMKRDEPLRRSTSKNLHEGYGQYIDFLTQNYLNEVKGEVYFSRLEKYDSVLQKYMDGEDVDIKVYNMLLKKVEENIPLINEYFTLKAKVLGMKKLHNYDLHLPISKVGEKKYSYEEGFKLVKEALMPLGKDYVAVLDEAKEKRWIDVMPSRNKYSGAYSSCLYGYPPIVLMNYMGNLDSVSTLAHELGHSMQSYLSNKNQPRTKAGYPIFLAEIASTTNELLLMQHLLHTLPKKDRVGIYDDLFDRVHSTIFRQVMFSEFEKYALTSVEQDKPLDKDKLCSHYFSLCKKFMPKLSLISELKYEWARIPHFFMGFYVYKYAIGMISAFNFSSRILAGEEGAARKYLGFLSAGGHKAPNEILKEAGCDLEDEKTYDRAFELIRQMLQEFKSLLKSKK